VNPVADFGENFLVDLGGHNKNRSGGIAGLVIALDHG
jgi:hypothetical protein